MIVGMNYISLWDDDDQGKFGVPTYATPGSCAIDLRACLMRGGIGDLIVTLHPNESMFIKTGLKLAVDDDLTRTESNYGQRLAGLVIPRSGLGSYSAKHRLTKGGGLVLSNAAGLIDTDYRGEIIIPLHNQTEVVLAIEHGQAVAQLLFTWVESPNFVKVDKFKGETVRGDNGFGHTDAS